MVKKLQKISDDRTNRGIEMAGAVKDSAQQIWLAGLGAFSKAQAEGGKVFESLVKEGLTMQRKTQTAAQERITEAASRMTGMASDLGTRVAGPWDKLETIFEDRVAKSLTRLGVPTSQDMDVLSARLDALVKSMHASAPATASKPPAKAARKSRTVAAKKVPAKKPAAPKPTQSPEAARTARSKPVKTSASTARATAKESAAP